MLPKIMTAFLCFFLLGIGNLYADWTLDKDNSTLAFGSIKKNSIGESHYFQHIDGKITDKGDIALIIDLSSVETWVDIRNDRIKEFLFETKQFPVATLLGHVNLDDFKDLKVGEQKFFETYFDFDLHGYHQKINAELIIMRLTETSVVVIPSELIYLNAEKFNLLSGLNTLKSLAKLSSISSSIPVVFHLTFHKTSND